MHFNALQYALQCKWSDSGSVLHKPFEDEFDDDHHEFDDDYEEFDVDYDEFDGDYDDQGASDQIQGG